MTFCEWPTAFIKWLSQKLHTTCEGSVAVSGAKRETANEIGTKNGRAFASSCFIDLGDGKNVSKALVIGG